ncbi:MAG: hypothetical protein AB2L14_31080 [Candidatus Xenobiia bacterium LiM19]
MKRIIPILFFTFILLLIGLSYTLNPTLKHLLMSGNISRIDFPWDPLEWDTLRDMPLGYKSLGDENDSTPVYKTYLKDPKKLGYAPSNSYFYSVLALIKENSVKNVTDAEFLLGIEKELKKLFKEADVKEEPSLTDERLDRKFMERLRKKYDSRGTRRIYCFCQHQRPSQRSPRPLHHCPSAKGLYNASGKTPTEELWWYRCVY